MTKVTLGLQNHWRILNGEVGIVPRDLTFREIRSNRYLAEGGVGIIPGGNTAGEHCINMCIYM